MATLPENMIAGVGDWWANLTTDPTQRATDRLNQSGAPNALAGGQWSGYERQSLDMANRLAMSPATNPFDLAAANMMQQSQQALVGLMQDTLGKDSVAEVAQSRAQQQNVRQGYAQGRGARTPLEQRQVGLRQAQVGNQLAEQGAQGRSQEFFQQASQLGNTAAQTRQADLASRRADWQSALREQALRDEQRRFYMGENLNETQRRLQNQSVLDKLNAQMLIDQQQKQTEALTKPMQAAATTAEVATKIAAGGA